MRLHFAAELILELVYREIEGVEKIGAHISPDKARIDFHLDRNISCLFPSLVSQVRTLVDRDLEIESAFSDESGQRRVLGSPRFRAGFMRRNAPETNGRGRRNRAQKEEHRKRQGTHRNYDFIKTLLLIFHKSRTSASRNDQIDFRFHTIRLRSSRPEGCPYPSKSIAMGARPVLCISLFFLSYRILRSRAVCSEIERCRIDTTSYSRTWNPKERQHDESSGKDQARYGKR